MGAEEWEGDEDLEKDDREEVTEGTEETVGFEEDQEEAGEVKKDIHLHGKCSTEK